VHSRAENFYAVWRQDCHALVLRDSDAPPPEKLLQAVWQHQRILRGELKTAEGKILRVLHPGFASREGGPDFRGAVLKFGDEPAVTGDVEIDRQTSGWRAHGHDRNPNFQNVILHVVWEYSKAPSRLPLLSLKNVLDAPASELALALESESGLPADLRGKCSAALRDFSEPQLAELLHAAAQVRFENKANAILNRAKICGWEQVLWENLFKALGYKHNSWPMVHLAENKWHWLSGVKSAFEIQSRLLGISGLLPDELTRSQKTSDTFLRRAWDFWWRERDAYADCTLPKTVWKFHGLRPANHPQRRLVLAAHWLASDNLLGKIEGWITAETPDKKLLSSLHEIFRVERDEFWSWHWTFKSPRLTEPQPLLGAARVTDLAVNVLLPWLWVRAKEGRSEKIQREVERRFFAWPAAEDNSVLKLARQRLLGAGARPPFSNHNIFKTAAAQQGLMQIVRDFCEQANAVCADCRFPDLVRGGRTPAVT
jgi:Protein of unknown function (DUF2851)